MTVLFLPFAALARDEATAKLCRQMPRLIGAELERAAEMHNVRSQFLSSRGTAADGTAGLVATLELPGPSDLETTARMYGADLIVSGKFGLGERNLLLEVRLYDVRNRQEVFAKRFETYPSYYFDAIEEAKIRIVQTLGIELNDEERVTLLRRSTESWQSLLYYLLAEDDRYALSLGIPPVNSRGTLDLFREALAIDPEFTLASQSLQHFILLLIEQDRVDLTELYAMLQDYSEVLSDEFQSALKELH